MNIAFASLVAAIIGFMLGVVVAADARDEAVKRCLNTQTSLEQCSKIYGWGTDDVDTIGKK